MVRHASDKTAALLPNVSPAGEGEARRRASPSPPTSRPELCSLVRCCGSDSKSCVSFSFLSFSKSDGGVFVRVGFLFAIQFFVNVGFALTPTSLLDFLHEMDHRQPSSSVRLLLRTARPFCSLGPKITAVMHLKRLAVSVFFFSTLVSGK